MLPSLVIQNILRLPGGYSGTPPLDPISNSTVKRSCADGTTLWESRSSPGIPRMFKIPSRLNQSPVLTTGLFLCLLLDHDRRCLPGRLFAADVNIAGILNEDLQQRYTDKRLWRLVRPICQPGDVIVSPRALLEGLRRTTCLIMDVMAIFETRFDVFLVSTSGHARH